MNYSFYINLKFAVLAFALIGLILVPAISLANYYTLPIDEPGDSDISLTAWFDHDEVSSQMTRYDGSVYVGSDAELGTCTHGEGCYDGHHGIDWATNGIEKEVIAADNGVVGRVKWENINDPNQGYGFHVGLYHEAQNHCTVYAHMASTTALSLNDDVLRGQQVGTSSDTGVGGYHLHFGVYDGTDTSECVSLPTVNQIDPYGWRATTTDPWPHNSNYYLWTTDPVSTSTHTEITGNINTSTTWRGVYVIDGSPTIAQGVTLTIRPGTVVKFHDTASNLTVNGKLKVEGKSYAPAYFTSYHDDSVGGDTNDNGTSTSPGSSDWSYIRISSTGEADFDHAVVSYGGDTSPFANIHNNGGVLTFTNSTSSYANFYGIQHEEAATSTITSSTFYNNDLDGLRAFDSGYLSFHDNHFEGNSDDAVDFNVFNGLTFSNSGNTAIDNSLNAIYLAGSSYTGTLNSDSMPYAFGTYSIRSGETVTVASGTILKADNANSKITVDGTLDVNGTSDNPVYFTSYNDDIGGDMTGNGTSTGTSGDWETITITTSTATADFDYAIVRYGGDCCDYANIYNDGGVLIFTNSTSSHSGSRGIRQAGSLSTSTISSSALVDNTHYGARITGGNMEISQSTISGNSSYGVYSTSPLVDAENNWWGDSSGPYHPDDNPDGTGDEVSDNVDFDPWLSSQP